MKNFWFCLFILVAISATAQKVDLSNPRATYRTFYENLDKEKPDVGSASKVITHRQVLSKSKRESYVQTLKKYLDDNGIIIIIDSISNDKNYKDANNSNSIRISNLIMLEKIGSSWYFSNETLSIITGLATENETPKEIEEEKDDGILADNRRDNIQRQAELHAIFSMPVNLSTPYDALNHYVVNADSNAALASRIISVKHIPNVNDRINIIEKLRRFFEGKGVIIDLDKVPEDPDFTDSLYAAKYTYQISYRFPEIYLEKEGNYWMLSKESALKIPTLYNMAFPFGTDRFFKYIPTEGQNKYLGLYSWQYIAILILIIISFLIFKLFKWLFSISLLRLFRATQKESSKNYVAAVVRPVALLIAFIWAETASHLLQLPIKVTAFLSISIEVLIPFFATVASYHSVNVFSIYLTKIAIKENSNFDDQLVPLIRKILKVLVVIIGGIFIIKQLGGNINVLLGTLSVGGLALALAAQDTIKNFFGSIMIFMDKPFQAGHWVTTADGLDGTVERVGFRSTRIRTFSNSLISIPNGRLSDNAIDNHGHRAYRRFKTTVAIKYDTPPQVIELFIQGMREIVESHPHTRKDVYHIYLNDLGPHSLNILFYIFFITPEWGKELQYRHEIIISIMNLADTLGVHFAFPTQTLHMEDFPGKESLASKYMSRKELEVKMREFFDEQKQGNAS